MVSGASMRDDSESEISDATLRGGGGADGSVADEAGFKTSSSTHATTLSTTDETSGFEITVDRTSCGLLI